MSRRLPPQPDEWIDRSRPIEFCFEGESYQGLAGDVITSALCANGVRMVGRSFKYHRPRSSYSVANHDANALFTDGKRPAIPGDATPIEAGLDLMAVNTVGGLRKDRLRFTERLSRFMPVGFYYKAFFRPRWLFPFHERQLRRIAGLGKVKRDSPPPCSPKDYAWCDVVVVGSGPSGLCAALAAAECGARVTIVEQHERLGGSLAWQLGSDAHAARLRGQLLAQVEAHANIEIRTRTIAGGYYADHWVALFDDRKLTKLRAKAVVFSTGAIEQPAVFQNNDLPGVMLASGAQRLIRLYSVRPFDAAVVLTANADGYRAALDLAQSGVEVRAIVDLRPNGEPSDISGRAAEVGISIRHGATVYEAIHKRDKSLITGAVVCPIDTNGRPDPDAGDSIECDGIAVSVGWMPNSGLLSQAGVRFRYQEQVEQLVPEVIPPGVFVAGRVNGIFDLEARLTDGRVAGCRAAAHIGFGNGDVSDAPSHVGRPPSHPYPIFEHPGKKNFVDFDEDIHLADFANAHQEGYDNVELMKRYTTVGMGPSQGKLANMNSVRILAKLNGKSINETGTTTARPFYQPVTIGHLAGRRFHPIRRTPMHDWHSEHDAEWFHAGAWYRPEYYHKGEASRADRILAEARAVRESLGLIDLGTLGKLFVCGPDAVEFLQRMYTSRFAKLAVGKQRYTVALDESGVLIEEGVVARLAENVFYVTATSSGAEGFHREMQRWALIWGTNVTLIRATGQYAAMNLAGPRSREAMADLTDIDLSPDAFPYLAAREGLVAGVRAIVLRVGFVGELGYEVHVPASHGTHVWQSLLEAGRSFDVQPFGLEAQRLLRLEKGHLIARQDTDALTTPHEANVAWTIGKNKDFFVGQRSLDILTKRSLERKLVGIRWPEGFAGPLPEPCHLIIDDGKIVGRITSIAHRSTLGYPLGLAFVHPRLAEPGTDLTIRVERGALSQATVASLPHYDPDNARQK